uniref:Plac8 onzin related protein 6 n=1 Tax=Xiphophorus couchianus TaxID=32473 RepID=A0A3B5LKZ2_9TELE
MHLDQKDQTPVVGQQPLMSETPPIAWKSGLFDCFEDVNTCCYGFWCCPFLACTVSRRFGENYCLPLCDMLCPVVFAACGMPLFFTPAALSLRASIRNKHGIKGSLCEDIFASCCCVWCSWCQMHRESQTEDPLTNLNNNLGFTALVDN